MTPFTAGSSTASMAMSLPVQSTLILPTLVELSLPQAVWLTTSSTIPAVRARLASISGIPQRAKDDAGCGPDHGAVLGVRPETVEAALGEPSGPGRPDDYCVVLYS